MIVVFISCKSSQSDQPWRPTSGRSLGAGMLEFVDVAGIVSASVLDTSRDAVEVSDTAWSFAKLV